MTLIQRIADLGTITVPPSPQELRATETRLAETRRALDGNLGDSEAWHEHLDALAEYLEARRGQRRPLRRTDGKLEWQ